MKTITIKGMGAISAKPDYVVVSLSMETLDMDYESAMQQAADKIAQLNESLATVGFEKESVKTTHFTVDTKYDNHRDSNGNYHHIFQGYEVRHKLKIAFDFDIQTLAAALSSVARCIAKPEISIQFTVKDTTAIQNDLLKSAAENAKQKATILCAASHTQLGELISIDYNWSELDIYSTTRYDVPDECMSKSIMNLDMEPDDIDLQDTVTFVWQML